MTAATVRLADGLAMLTVPAHELRRGDQLPLSGQWCTVGRNDDTTDGETGTRALTLTAADGQVRVWDVLASQPVAVLRPLVHAQRPGDNTKPLCGGAGGTVATAGGIVLTCEPCITANPGSAT